MDEKIQSRFMNILVQFKAVYSSNNTFPVQTRKSVTHGQAIMCVDPPQQLSLSKGPISRLT